MTNNFTHYLEASYKKTVLAKKFYPETLDFKSLPKNKFGVYGAVRMNPVGTSYIVLGVGSTKDFDNILPGSDLTKWMGSKGASHIFIIICDDIKDAHNIEIKLLDEYKHAKQLNTGALYRH